MTARISPQPQKDASSTPASESVSPRAHHSKEVATDWVTRSSIASVKARPSRRPGGDDGDGSVPSDAGVVTPPRNNKLELGLLVLVSGCLMWTFWLIQLTVYPNDTINRIMKTTEYDDGAFWLLIEPQLPLLIASVSGLAIVVAGYAFIILKLVRKYKPVAVVDQSADGQSIVQRSRTGSVESRVESMRTSVQMSMTRITEDVQRNLLTKFAASLIGEAVLPESRTRKVVVNDRLIDGDMVGLIEG